MAAKNLVARSGQRKNRRRLPSKREQGFDYGRLARDEAEDLRARKARILQGVQMLRRTVEEIGADIAGAKERLPHGTFRAWVRLELGMKLSTARNYVNAFKLIRKNPKFASLPKSAQFLLGARHVPATAQSEVLSILDRGERPGVIEVRKVVLETACSGSGPRTGTIRVETGVRPEPMASLPVNPNRSTRDLWALAFCEKLRALPLGASLSKAELVGEEILGAEPALRAQYERTLEFIIAIKEWLDGTVANLN